MLDPVTAILLALIVAVPAWLVFRPAVGLYWRWRQGRDLTDRVIREDALKHLHERQYSGRLATFDSLAGVLGVSTGTASELLKELIDRGFAEPEGDGYVLTPAGRSYALQVIRAHRLWERYLADETEVAASEIHAHAEREEHRLTPEQIEELEARLGFPTTDPHGDPIPSADGDIADKDGVPLTQWQPNRTGRIVHLEDEPPEVYAQLLTQGIRLGLDIRILDQTPQQIRIYTEDREFVIASVVASNITVAPIPPEKGVQGPSIRLSDLEEGTSATVLGLDEECRGLTRRRFMDLGLTPGTSVEVDRTGPFGDPRAYRIRGTVIALRREQADHILVSTGNHRNVARGGIPETEQVDGADLS
jgi:DtxR family Mn-dependent transcriptional regulator